MKYLRCIELCASAGIATLQFTANSKIRTAAAVEIDKRRCDYYRLLHNSTSTHKTKIINGDICDNDIKQQSIDTIHRQDISVAILSPPCTPFTTAGKNKNQEERNSDPRSYLIFDCLDVVKSVTNNLDYIMIENVPTFKNVLFEYNGQMLNIVDILCLEFADIYNIDAQIFDMSYYNVCTSRKRYIIRMWRKGLTWDIQAAKTPATLAEYIDFLPSLEAGENCTDYPLHNAPAMSDNIRVPLQHTPSGTKIMDSTDAPLLKQDGSLLTGFKSSYARASWDKPAYTITQGHRGSNSFHPGRHRPDGTWSDARNFTALELLLITGIVTPEQIKSKPYSDKTLKILDAFSQIGDVELRHIIADAIPPTFVKTMFKHITI